MLFQLKAINQKSISHFLIILACILSLILIINSNNVNSKRIEDKKLFDKVIKTRKLEENNICEKCHKELKEYYLTGDLEKIGLKNDLISYKIKDKEKKYIKALINRLENLIYGKDKDENNSILDLNLMKKDNNIKIYFKHLLPVVIFLFIGIILIPLWPAYCCFCCWDCCCCCCCKKKQCVFPCFIISFIFYILTISLCVYCMIKSNSIIIGIADTKCSIIKFFEQALEGETKQTLPKWEGLNNINNTLKNIEIQIEILRQGKLNELNNEIENINYKKNNLKNKMEKSGNAFFYINQDGSIIYNDLYSSDEYLIKSRGIDGRYVLDLIKIFGKRLYLDNSNEEIYEPKNSILDLWHNEYKIISRSADYFLEQALKDLEIITDNKNKDLLESFKQGRENLEKLHDFFYDIKNRTKDILISHTNYMSKHYNFVKKGFISFFAVIGVINIFLGIFILILYLTSGVICNNNSCCECLFKCSYHFLWNILYLFMVITFLLGGFFASVGIIGNDFVYAISFILSEENLGEGGENLIVYKLYDAKDYLDKLINSDGRIIDLLNINYKQINAFNNMKQLQKQINQIKEQFQKRKNFSTYFYYIDQLKARLNLSIIPMLIKDEYNITLPLNNDQYYESQADKFLKFDIELELMNTLIRTQEVEPYKNEQWKINSNSPNECNSENDYYFLYYEFNPIKCRPLNRDWIQKTNNIDIKTEAKIISDTLNFLDNAN